jgi:hypothetical protein
MIPDHSQQFNFLEYDFKRFNCLVHLDATGARPIPLEREEGGKAGNISSALPNRRRTRQRSWSRN